MSKEMTVQTELLPIEQGWGVIQHREGLTVNYSTRLRAVCNSLEEATAERERLQAAEGRLIYEIDSDPESHALDHISFSVAPVKLAGSTPGIIVQATYVLTEG